MGSFQDYVNQDGIESEIDEAAVQQQARDEKGRFIPERFKGKEIGDVIQSFEELEKLNSRQANDLGTMRKHVDELMSIQSQSTAPAVEPAKPLSVDDLYENPDEAIRRAAREEVSSEVTELRETLQEIRQKQITDEMEGKFPNWLEESQSSEFGEWCNQSPYRQHMVEAVRTNGDLAAAQELLGMYYDQKTSAEAEESNTQQTEVVQKQLRDATLESGGPAQSEVGDTYSRNDLLDARLAAKAGDLKAERWLAANSDAIANAYADGRIVD